MSWDGVPLRTAPFLAFDTETNIVDLSTTVPDLALVAVTNGTRHVIVRPEQLLDFLFSHRSAVWVGFNVSFDWHVVHKALAGPLGGTVKSSAGAVEEWTAVLDEGRLHDAMLLDFLARLADAGSPAHSIWNLGQAAQHWLGVPVDKSDPYRMRFGELIGKDWSDVEPGFFDYAIKDVAVTHALFARLYYEAGERYRRAMKAAYPALPRHGRWGLLTEGLQVKASVVLDEIGRNGMALDRARVVAATERLRLEVQGHVQALIEAGYGDIFSYYADGVRLKLQKTTGTPQLKMAPLRAHLTAVAEVEEIPADSLPRTAKSREVGTSLDDWREIAPDHQLVSHWSDMNEKSKLLQFLAKLDRDSVHPDYKPLVRTGRTSSTKPNIQNMPRVPWFRELFVARPGHRFVTVDYSFIELRTLAAVLLDLYGWSRLAETIKGGRDPHVYTAAIVMGITYDHYADALKDEKKVVKAWKDGGEKGDKPPTPYADGRQAAKAINFGVPGGLGAKSLASYAKANYGVELSPEQARDLRTRLITQVYPELARYLSDSPVHNLAESLMATKLEVMTELQIGDTEEDSGLWHGVRRLTSGHNKRPDGSSYSPAWKTRVWAGLAAVNRNPDLAGPLEAWKGGHVLHRKLFGATATTITGRVRAGVGYTEERNTKFQGLAADGAKNALYMLWRAGYRIVAFVHDEIVLEVPEAEADDALPKVERIMNEAMEAVWEGVLPSATEGHTSEKWEKR